MPSSYNGDVSVDLDQLPSDLADAVRRARLRLPAGTVRPFRAFEVDADIRAWAIELVRSGELRAAIDEVAASDPDLRS